MCALSFAAVAVGGARLVLVGMLGFVIPFLFSLFCKAGVVPYSFDETLNRGGLVPCLKLLSRQLFLRCRSNRVC